jgi:cytochrome c553
VSGVELFIVSFGIIFLTAGVLFVIWLLIRSVVVRVARVTADRTVAEVRRHNPPATVASGADSWSCASCKSVNRPDATACYRCHGDRAAVEGSQGRI